MPNDIDQPNVLLRLPQKIPTLPRLLYLTPPRRIPNAPRPFFPNPKCLLHPRPEADLLHHRRSRNFLAGKAAPRHCVHRLAAFAAPEGPRRITGVVAYLTFLSKRIKMWPKCAREVGSGDKKLDKGFLEDEAAGRTPAMDGMGRRKTIDSGLGSNGPVALAQDQFGELRRDQSSLGRESCGLGPGELFWTSSCEVRREKMCDFFGRSRRVPEGKGLRWGNCQRRWRVCQGRIEGGRARVTKAPVGIIIPSSFTR